MGKLFLTSQFAVVAPMITRILHDVPKGQKVLFIKTAAEAEEGDKKWLEDDRNVLRKIGLDPVDYTIAGKKESDFVKDFQDIHYVFISGGNTFYLLEKAQESGFIPFVTQFMQGDNVYFGSSAGSAIAGADIYPLLNLDEEEKAPKLKGYKGFGFIDLSLLPHWGSEKFKDRYLNRGLAHVYDDKYKLVFLTDNQFLYVEPDGSYSILEI